MLLSRNMAHSSILSDIFSYRNNLILTSSSGTLSHSFHASSSDNRPLSYASSSFFFVPYFATFITPFFPFSLSSAAHSTFGKHPSHFHSHAYTSLHPHILSISVYFCCKSAIPRKCCSCKLLCMLGLLRYFLKHTL